MKLKTRKDYREKRHQRIRRKISGTGDCPRMAICRSNRYLYVQFIDDASATTLAAVNSMGDGSAKSIAQATALGQRAAEVARKKGITQVVVDRSGFKFHGRIKAIVDAAVENGLSVEKKSAAPAEAAAAPTDDNEEAK